MRRSHPQRTLLDPQTRAVHRRQVIQLPFRSRWAVVTLCWPHRTWREVWVDLVYLVTG